MLNTLLTSAGIILTMLALRIISTSHNHLVEHLDRVSHHLQEAHTMSTQDAINAITAQLGKSKDEIVAKIADVQAQLDAASVPAEQVDLSALTAAAQALDDVVPDVVPDSSGTGGTGGDAPAE